MYSTIVPIWFLFAGIALIMLGSGLQGTLIGVRATTEGFLTVETGLVMSAYYLGFLFGSKFAPRIVQRVGHIRTFGALASVASATVLIHAVFANPAVWMLIRVASGFCFAGLTVVTESWLNHLSTNIIRGRLFSIYMVVQLSGLAGGQFLLNLADPGGYDLFILISVLISFSVVPLLLTSNPGPVVTVYSKIQIRKLYNISPLGVVGTFGVGIANGAFLGMGAVYAQMSGFSPNQVAEFMATLILGGVVLQWPIGRLSDHVDRRTVLTGVTFLAAVAALLCNGLGAGSPRSLFIFSFVLGGLSLSLYSLCVAHLNDHLKPEQMVMGSSGLTFVAGIGALLGPFTVSGMMNWMGPDGFFLYLFLIHALIGVFAFYRMLSREPVPVEDQTPYVPLTTKVAPATAALVVESVVSDAGENEDRLDG